ncbi:hypothetical protein M9458_029332, partial [Cirrhinus mrigala]
HLWVKTRPTAAFDFDNTSSFNMGRIAKEVSGQVLCFIGFVGICVCCGIPMWRVTSYIGANIVTGQVVWDGLWMNCVMQSTGQMQCKIQDSIMRLTQDMQAARALTVIAIVIGFVGMLLTFVGGRCSSCLKNESSMAKVLICGGILCIIAGVICLIPVCWSSAYTISDFQSILTIETQKRELGAVSSAGRDHSVYFLSKERRYISKLPSHVPLPRTYVWASWILRAWQNIRS